MSLDMRGRCPANGGMKYWARCRGILRRAWEAGQGGRSTAYAAHSPSYPYAVQCPWRFGQAEKKVTATDCSRLTPTLLYAAKGSEMPELLPSFRRRGSASAVPSPTLLYAAERAGMRHSIPSLFLTMSRARVRCVVMVATPTPSRSAISSQESPKRECS